MQILTIIFRPKEIDVDGEPLIIRPLGAGREVGRSCIYMTYKGKSILFDCGIMPRWVLWWFFMYSCYGDGSLPLLDQIDDFVDLVLISHFHLDHCGALPVLQSTFVFDNLV